MSSYKAMLIHPNKEALRECDCRSGKIGDGYVYIFNRFIGVYLYSDIFTEEQMLRVNRSLVW